MFNPSTTPPSRIRPNMSVLSRAEIIRRISGDPTSPGRLYITPLLSDDQIGPASVDIRLGSSIIVPRKTYVDSHDPTDRLGILQAESRLYERIRLRYNSKFVLHPNEVILGVTFEYVSTPSDVFCMIVSRSSWGRMGLVIATATVVQPGFRGCLTLELTNMSDSPIALYPGLPVGQLVLMQTSVATQKGGRRAEVTYPEVGRYDCPTEAEPPMFFASGKDDELPFWGSPKAMRVSTPQTAAESENRKSPQRPRARVPRTSKE
jgi:dCTP deaminase